MIPILQMRTLRLREAQSLFPHHTVIACWAEIQRLLWFSVPNPACFQAHGPTLCSRQILRPSQQRMVGAGLSVEIKHRLNSWPHAPACLPSGFRGVCAGPLDGVLWALGGAGGWGGAGGLCGCAPLPVRVTRRCARVQFCLLFVEAEFIYRAVSFKCTYIYIYFSDCVTLQVFTKIEYSSLCCMVGSCWSSILRIVFCVV